MKLKLFFFNLSGDFGQRNLFIELLGFFFSKTHGRPGFDLPLQNHFLELIEARLEQ